MNFYTIIPTLGNKNKLSKLLNSLQNQTIKPKNIFLILDKTINFQEKQEFLFFLKKNFWKLNITFVNNIDFNFIPQKWVSYVRNFGLALADKMCKDDDIVVFTDDDICLADNNFFQKIIYIYEKEKNFLIFPTVINWYTKKIETQGIEKISPWTLKIKFIKTQKKKRTIKMTSLQLLAGPYKIFKNFKFDERFKFVYEDLDFTYTITKSWIKIWWFSDLKIYHWDKKENKAQKSYVSNPFLAYQKWKNRILFVKKHFNIWEKLIFFSIWCWIHTFWLLIIILLWWTRKLESMKALIKSCKYIVEIFKNQ